MKLLSTCAPSEWKRISTLFIALNCFIFAEISLSGCRDPTSRSKKNENENENENDNENKIKIKENKNKGK